MDWKENWSRCVGKNEDWTTAERAHDVDPDDPEVNSVNTVNCVNKTPKCISGASDHLQDLCEYLAAITEEQWTHV